MKLIKYGFGISFLLLILIFVTRRRTSELQKNAEPEVPFHQMTPAQHLARAKSLMQAEDRSSLSKEQLGEAAHHMSAIPDSAPESKEAIAVQKQSLQAAKEQYIAKVRRKYTNDLEALLRDQGFDIVVTELGDQLILANDLFNDEGNRLEFLATIRKIRDKQGLCDAGFHRVALSGGGMFTGAHIYSLGCRESKAKTKE